MQRLFDLLAGVAAAHIHGERHPLELVIACLGERRDAGQKLCRNIVDTKKADILQCVHRNRFSPTGKPADDQKIHTIFPLMP